MNRIQKVLGSAALTSLLVVAPLIASADSLNANASSGVVINPSGIVRVIGADVTAVSNGVFNAVTTIGSTILNWIVNVSATAQVFANGSTSATTTDIKVGDKVSFMGALASSTGSSLTVAASKVRDLTTFPLRRVGAGTIASINVSTGSFVITSGDRTITVQTNASTTIAANGTTTMLASLLIGQKVWVAGTSNANGSVITATHVVVKNSEDRKHKEEAKNDNDDDDNDGDRGNRGRGNASTSVSWNASFHADGKGKSDEARGIRAGLNLLGGLRIGKDD